nr:zinc finger, CCHC-type [Tanacetum cinerariifolium]
MIEPNEKTESDTKKDKTAIAFLYQALPEEQLLQITKHKTTKAVWDALKIRHVGVNHVQQAKQQTLKSEFEMLQMNENESIDSFVTRLTDIINKAASIRLAYEDSTLKMIQRRTAENAETAENAKTVENAETAENAKTRECRNRKKCRNQQGVQKNSKELINITANVKERSYERRLQKTYDAAVVIRGRILG